MLPFSQAAENNKAVILAVLAEVFGRNSAKTTLQILEIGSGTGQHAVHFALGLPHVIWHTSDLAENHKAISARLLAEGPENVRPPIEIDVANDPWTQQLMDGIFSANALHIMSEPHVAHFFRGAGEVIKPGGHLCVYGPFKYGGAFTTDSNARFDVWLKQQNPVSGVRDTEACKNLAKIAGFHFVADHKMPANNQLLVWEKQ